MDKKDPLKIGVIGAGRIGNIHAQNIITRIPNAEVGAIADINLQAAEQIGAQFAIPLITENHQELLDDASIDAVVICSATATHTQMIRDSAAAGKHIFCEKPIDFDLTRIDQALQAVEEANVKLQIGFNRRFDPGFRRVREMIADGKIGDPHILRITSRDPEPLPLDYLKVSGGIFLDMTIHDFDMARYLIGSEVTQIYAAGAVLVDPKIGELGDLDTTLITLHFENGVIGGAGLDVFEEEPLPSDHKLWGLPNVLMTPHIAVRDAENLPERRFQIILDNARRFLNDEPLNNIVDKSKWY